MLNLMSDFLDEDADLQFINDQQAAIKLNRELQKNLLFFKHFNNDIHSKINAYSAQRYCVFSTKNQQLNIVEIASGRVLYSQNPEAEIKDEVASFCQTAPIVSLTSSLQPQSHSAVSKNAVILSFGIGLGLHLLPLIKQVRPSVLVIYEADMDLFITSLHTTDWAMIYETAAALNTQISLQLGNSGATITADLQELQQLLPNLDKCYLYRHLAHPVSDEIFNYLIAFSGQPEKLLRQRPQFLGYVDDHVYISERFSGILANQQYKDAPKTALFEKNLVALKQYYPILYHVFVDYIPKDWRVVDIQGQFNLWCDTRKGLFYDDVTEQSAHMVERFLHSPLDNQVILNQGGLEKMSNYVHFKAVKKLQPVFKNLKPRVFDENTDVDNLIVLGVGLGLHIDILLSKREVKNLFVFEPNLDFFYASLFVTDWATLFTKIAESKQRIYFNIGGSGEEYFQDIMGQYYQTGAYGIAKSQIFPAFLTPGMRNALEKLYSQLKIIVAMGETFDHVRFSLAHTFHSMKSGHYFLKQQRQKLGMENLQDIPIFIVGNGPSLDESYTYIREHREKIIVVSCGTALRSLYRLGITPDFHAEIEQNRATFNWISQVDDPQWLKKIALLSVNGIHPETAGLFKAVYLAYKDGESSTNFFRSYLEQQGIHISALSHAYPTVSNFSVDFFTSLGFKHLYLFGIDLGYLSVEQHHSKHSAYYHNDGAGVMDADKIFNAGIQIKGNFRDCVQTKAEFDFSRSILEMTIANLNKNTAIYNCSDGAYIQGAMPLRPQNILVSIEQSASLKNFEELFTSCFYSAELQSHTAVFADLMQHSGLSGVVDEMLMFLVDVDNYQDAKKLIDTQWQTFIEAYYSDNKLGFYLLCGSVIYMLSVMTRILPVSNEPLEQLEELKVFNNVLEIWREYLLQANLDFTNAPFKHCAVDVSFLFNKESSISKNTKG
ncbi:MAG: DUF115 domain-containing protein [Alishewanella sp.]|nr:DUF115 domain-containing protein [Alishewanella sp.]